MHSDSFIQSYRGYTIWVRVTGFLARSSMTWSAAYQLCLTNVPLHQYIDAAGKRRSAKAAAARALRVAKIDIDTRLERVAATPGKSSASAAGRVSPAWLLRLAESRWRKG